MGAIIAPEAVEKLVGSSVRPYEARPLIMGEGCFLNDVRLPGMLHVAFLRSPFAHARIRRIDTGPALALPGVVTVLTARELEGRVAPFRSQANRYSGASETVQPLLVREKVRFAGEAVCAVVAADRATAEDARERIAVDYEPLPCVTDARGALEPGSPLVHEGSGSNALISRDFETGDVDGAFRAAAATVRRSFRIHRKTALALEGRGCVAAYRGGPTTLTVWISHQLPYVVRHLMAEHLGLPENELRVIVPDTGGGFGQKASVYPEEFVVAYLALTLKRAVKWVEDRGEHFLASSHSRDQFIEVAAAVDPAGRILALESDVLVDVGAYSIYLWTAGMEPLQTAGLMPGPYRLTNYRYKTRGVATNKTPVGPYRAVGRPSAAAAIELLLDDIAERLGLDPVDVRLANLIRDEDLPFRNVNRLIHDRTSYVRCLHEALDGAGYQALRAEQRRLREGGRVRGIGVACYAELTGLGTRTPVGPGTALRPGRDAVTLRLEPSGVLRVMAAMPSQGQRIGTALAQVAADELGLRFEDVRVTLNDTDAVPYGFGTFASRTAVIGGGAVIRAARELRRRILVCAGYLLEADPEDLEIRGGHISTLDGTRGIALGELTRLAYFEAQKLPEEVNPGFEVTTFYDPHFGSFANATHIAVVDVDRETGEVEIVSYLAVEDCGRLINPAVVHGQIVGGIVQGIGEALLEELVYDASGQLCNGTLADYLAPSAPEVPFIELRHLETPSAAEGGFKGVGEGSQTGAVAAICCAVADALRGLGVRLAEFPAAPNRVLDALAAAGGVEPR